MSKVVIVRTRTGGSVTLDVPDGYNFAATMKAVRSDGMLLSDNVMVPFEAIDSILLTDRGMSPFPPKPDEKAN